LEPNSMLYFQVYTIYTNNCLVSINCLVIYKKLLT
jgi:hypothetical protein